MNDYEKSVSTFPKPNSYEILLTKVQDKEQCTNIAD